ncbi:uncharacterized protein ACRADG_004775 [Cochliomyia hominivorax]
MILKLILICIFLNGAFGLHCHKCVGNGKLMCNQALGNERYSQLCNYGLRYCAVVYEPTTNVYLRRGCSNQSYCDHLKSQLKHCCNCDKDDCNWSIESCINRSTNRRQPKIFFFLLIFLFIIWFNYLVLQSE